MQHPLTMMWLTVFIWWFQIKKKEVVNTMAHYSPRKRINCPRCCHHMNPFWSKLIKNDEAAEMETVRLCVVSELWWAGKTRRDWDDVIPPHRHRVCHEVWMWAEKKWQTRSGRRWSKKHVCLRWVLLLPVTSIHFSSPWKKCVRVHARLVIPIRGFVFSVHYLFSLSSEQFYFQPII